MLEKKKKRVKMVSKSGVGAEREKGVKNAKNGRKGYIHIAMIRILAMRSNVEICTLILTSNERHKTSELKLQIRSKHKKKCSNKTIRLVLEAQISMLEFIPLIGSILVYKRDNHPHLECGNYPV